MNRTFGDLTIRAVHEEERVIEGIATTNQRDLMKDIVESAGAEYSLPIPFLMDHDHRDAVGEVEHVEVTPTGIRFLARIKKIAEPGLARDLVDKAWVLIKNGLRRSVSIGFLPLEQEPIKGGGYRYTRWSFLELSAVAVPANPGARITATRAAAAKHHVVKLTPKQMRVGKMLAEADRRSAARKRLGIPLPVVKLTEADIRKGREIVAKRAAAAKPGHTVRIDPVAVARYAKR